MTENIYTTYTTCNEYECPYCGEKYNSLFFGNGVQTRLCAGEDGCGEKFVIATLDLSVEDFASIVSEDGCTPDAQAAVNILASAGYAIEVWGIDPLDVKIVEA